MCRNFLPSLNSLCPTRRLDRLLGLSHLNEPGCVSNWPNGAIFFFLLRKAIFTISVSFVDFGRLSVCKNAKKWRKKFKFGLKMLTGCKKTLITRSILMLEPSNLDFRKEHQILQKSQLFSRVCLQFFDRPAPKSLTRLWRRAVEKLQKRLFSPR